MMVIVMLWLRMEEEFHGMSSHTGRIRTNKNGFALVSDDASACRTTLSMSSGSYSGLAMEEVVHRNLKESSIVPKTVSFGKAEH
jgi:hypothetical protein